jgi:hypothetical protein
VSQLKGDTALDLDCAGTFDWPADFSARSVRQPPNSAFFRAAQNLRSAGTRNKPMNTEDRQINLDQGFDATMETVMDAFLQEGFTIWPVDTGDLRNQPTYGGCLRYAVLRASLPELTFDRHYFRANSNDLLGCQISVYELARSCTIVTATSPVVDYPLLASLVPRLADRMGIALRWITCASSSVEAA